MREKKFTSGFRFSLLDSAVLLLSFLCAWYVSDINIELSLLVLFVVGHFFYFCNIIRMSRAPEIIWSLCFIFLYSMSGVTGFISFVYVCGMSIIITISLTFVEMKKVSYHGILWTKINPHLEDWFYEYK